MCDVREALRCGLTSYHAITRVQAGEITAVTEDGCFVLHHDLSIEFHPFQPRMLQRYRPVPGDFWLIYDDQYQTILPRWAFDAENYVAVPVEA
jgi:hypothetical protein